MRCRICNKDGADRELHPVQVIEPGHGNRSGLRRWSRKAVFAHTACAVETIRGEFQSRRAAWQKQADEFLAIAQANNIKIEVPALPTQDSLVAEEAAVKRFLDGVPYNDCFKKE